MMMVIMMMMMIIIMIMMVIMIVMLVIMMASVGISYPGCHASSRSYPRQLRWSGFHLAIRLFRTIRPEDRGGWTELKSIR